MAMKCVPRAYKSAFIVQTLKYCVRAHWERRFRGDIK